MANKALKFIALVSWFLFAEIGASWWIWGRSPTDSIRVWYSGFWTFESGRLVFWAPIFGGALAMGLLGWALLIRGVRRSGPALSVFGAILTIASELATSMLYWRSPRSADLRDLFQSVWVWHRVPQASDLGWPSFRFYLWAHFFPWLVVLIAGVAVWSVLGRRRPQPGTSTIESLTTKTPRSGMSRKA